MTGFMVLSILLTLRFPGVAGARSPQECDGKCLLVKYILTFLKGLVNHIHKPKVREGNN